MRPVERARSKVQHADAGPGPIEARPRDAGCDLSQSMVAEPRQGERS